jgi:membrane fusion protein, heavy metal efflux system
MSRFSILLVLAASTALSGCSKDAPAPAAVHDEATSANSVQALKAAGVVLQKITKIPLDEELRAAGEVVDDAYATTLITPRVEALVVRRHAKLGDEVQAGAPLVTLSSVETAEAQGDLQRAEQEWRRVQALGTDAVSGRRMDEARIGVEQARAKAAAYGSNGGRANGEFTLTAPHSGRLTEDDFVVGQRIEPGDTLFRLVDESTVWVDAKLPAEMDARVPIGSIAQIVAGDQRLTGNVVQRAHRTAESTRNGLVRIEVPNPDDRLHAGDYVDAFLKSDGGAVAQLSVPTTALAQLQGQTVVFRQSADGEIEPVPVVAGAVVGDRTLISDGLAEGDTVVVAGTFVIKARLLKSQLGEGDEH